MKSLFRIILGSALVVMIAHEPRAHGQAGKTTRKPEKVFDQDGPVYDASQKRAAPAPVNRAAESGPTNWAVAGAKPVNYSKLELKIISGLPNKRIATINNQSFFAGDSLKVTVGTNRLAVTCQEIRERSVVVKVAGETEPRELKLAGSP